MSSAGVEDTVLSDAELITAARTGDSDAFGHLYERHAGAAWAVARQYTNSAADAEDVVADAFTKVYSIIQTGGGPDVAFRAYLFTVVRRLGMLRVQGGRRVEPTDDVTTFEAAVGPAASTEDPALEGFERGVVSRAYRTLPERWQAVLWYTEVEAMSPAQIAPLLGLSANGVAALAYRAREGLRQAYLQEHLQEPLTEGCRGVSGKLGSYVRGGLAKRETAQVDAHVETCGDCRALLLELGDVNHGMRVVIAPLVLGVLGLGALSHGLPVGGGIASGFAALGEAGTAGTAGAGAGAGAGASTGAGAGAAGTGAGAGAAASTGVASTGAASVAVGAGAVGATTGAAAGSAAAAAGATGFAALVGALPVGVLGAVAATVAVGAAVAVGGVLGVFSGDAAPTGEADGPLASASPTPGSTVRPSATPTPTVLPTVAPTDLPTLEAEPDDELEIGAPSDEDDATAPGAVGPRTSPTTAPRTGTGTDDEPDVTPGPEPDPDVTPDPEPDPDETTPPPPVPATIGVATTQADVVLTAGASNRLSVELVNSGGLAATDLVATVTLPSGVNIDEVRTELAPVALAGGAAGRFAVASGSTTWVCGPARTAGAGRSVAECTLDTLPPNASARLVLQVVADETVDADPAAEVTIAVRGTGLATQTRPISLRTPIAASAPRLAHGGSATSVPLVVPSGDAGHARPFTLDLLNAGQSSTSTGGVTLRLPVGVHAVMPPADALWACTAASAETGDVVTCGVAAGHSLPGRSSAVDLTLGLYADGSAARVPDAALVYSLQPDAPGRSQNQRLALGVDGYLQVTSAAGTVELAGPDAEVDIPVTVTNVGGRTVDVPTLRLTAPDGTRWAEPDPVTTLGWTCSPPRPSLEPGAGGDTVVCTGAPLAAGASVQVGTRLVKNGMSEDGTLGTAEIAVETPRIDGPFPAARVLVLALPYGPDPTPTPTPSVTPTPTPSATPTPSVTPTPSATPTPSVTPTPTPTVTPTPTPTVTPTPTPSVTPTPTPSGSPTAPAATPRYSSPGSGHTVTEIGAPLLTCTARGARDTCAPALAGTSGSDDLTLVPLNAAGGRTVSSSATLELPAGRQVAWAGLYWASNSVHTRSNPLPAVERISVRAPGTVGYTPVTGRVTVLAEHGSGRPSEFQAFADVTSLVSQHGAGEWSVADIADLRDGSLVDAYAGWALVVVYADPAGGQVAVHDTPLRARDASTPTLTVATEPGGSARIGVVAWEGDRGLRGDRLLLDGSPLTPKRAGSSVGSPDNAFDGTATGYAAPNSLMVDAKGFARVPTTGSTAALRPTSAAPDHDDYVVGVVTVETRQAGR